MSALLFCAVAASVPRAASAQPQPGRRQTRAPVHRERQRPIRFWRAFRNRRTDPARYAQARRELGRSVRAFFRGVAKSPRHLIEHLRRPKTLLTALAVSAGLGVGATLLGIPPGTMELIAKGAVVLVLGNNWVRTLRRVRKLPTREQRLEAVGKEAAMTLLLGTHLAGIELLGGHAHGGAATGHTGTTIGGLARAAGQGVLGFHDLLFWKHGKMEHEHDH